MIRYFPHLTVAAWVASLAAVNFLPVVASSVMVLVTSLMLLFERWMNFRAGEEFNLRVKRVLDVELAAVRSRTTEMERVVGDVREAQLRSGAAFRGGAGRV